MNPVQIADATIGPGHPCFIIAEAGSNHDGNLEQARALIEAAAKAGVDAVKFQLFSADKIAAKTDNQVAQLTDEFGQYASDLHQLFKQLELPPEWLANLADYARSLGLIFLATPFDEEAADQLDRIGVPAFKNASCELVHLPLLRHVAKKGKPVIVSTGMGDLTDIQDALDAIYEQGNHQAILTHCGTSYPMQFEEANLAAMETMRRAFQVPVGYSDHTVGLTVPIAAVALGADLIEKHFTLDRNLHGPDHPFALIPGELKQMVEAIRDTEAAIGSPIKRMAPTEAINHERGRRSLFAAVDIKAGTTITVEMISVLRPGTGLAPKLLDVVVGRTARVAIKAHQPITWDEI